MKDTTFRGKSKLMGSFARAIQHKPTRLPITIDSDQETPAAMNESAGQETATAVIDEEVPINLDGKRSQEQSKQA